MKIAFTDQPIPGSGGAVSFGNTGAELVFLGRVRDRENGKPITALAYEHYAGMAEKKLAEIARRVIDEFDIQDIECIHRIGPVPVGDAAVKIIVRSRHRKAGLMAMDRFIDQLKEDVPIWKWGVGPDGRHFPSDAGL